MEIRTEWQFNLSTALGEVSAQTCVIATVTHWDFGDTLSFGSHRMRPAMLRYLSLVLGLLGPLIAPAAAQDPLRGECLAMSQAPARATPVGLRRLAKADEV